jgi:8-oxo-dGTP pyrophosphatase MutT (NUDIX family)
MHRSPLLNLLTSYSEKHPAEQECTTEIVEFVNQHNSCFDRELAIGHITGSAWIVNHAGTHTLLTHHKKLNKWLQPGGHADGESDILQVAKREADEESGLTGLAVEDGKIFDVDVHQIPTRANEMQHLHYDIRFVFLAHGSEAFVVSEESHNLAWVEIIQLEDYNVDESVMRMAQKWIQRSSLKLA